MKTIPRPGYETICETLRSIGIPRRYCGFQRIAYTVFYAVQDENRLINFRAKIYPLVAEQCSTSIASIESSIRTIIDDYWKNADERLIWEVFRRRWGDKPTVSQFIEELTDYVQRDPDGSSGR